MAKRSKTSSTEHIQSSSIEHEKDLIRDRLSALAQERGGVSALARAARLPQRTVANYFDRKSEPSASAIVAIARGTGTSIAWLLGMSEEQRSSNASIDSDVLRQILMGIDEGEHRRGVRIAPSAKAKLAVLFYEMWLKGELPDRDEIARLTAKAA